MSVFVIAEIGINHNGDLNIAKKLIDRSKQAGFHVVKFQKRTIEEVYSKEELDDIDHLIYGCDKSNEELLKHDGIIEEDIEEFMDDVVFSEKKLILNNWKLKDTIYKIEKKAI